MENVLLSIRDNLCNLALLNLLLGVLMVLNIILGAVMAKAGNTFDLKTFVNGVLKALLVALCMLVFCFVLEVFPIVLERVGFAVPADLVTFMEVVAIVVVAFVKYAKGCYNKLKTLLDVDGEEDEAKAKEYMNPHVKDEVEGEG